MNKKFRIGERVKIREDLTEEHGSDNWYPNFRMLDLKGQDGIITEIVGSEAYRLDITGYRLGWTDEMLVLAEQNKNINLIFNDRTVMAKTKDGNVGIAICHPEDVYNRSEGIRIAICRLLNIEPFPKVEEKIIDNTKALKDYPMKELLEEVLNRVE